MLRLTLSLLLLGLSCLFATAYYGFYFKWRTCFNELGRCFDPETATVYLAQTGIIWLPLALLTFAAGLYQLLRFIQQKRSLKT